MLQVMRTRVCDIDKIQMQYANTIYQICSDVFRVPQGMTKICEHLYLGNFEDALNVEKLSKVGITYIINTVDALFDDKMLDTLGTGKEFYGDQVRYLGFYSEDEERYPILQHFEEVYNFIEEARNDNAKCLIPCRAGINRSGCLATAYYMVSKNIGPISAAQYVFNARGMLLSNEGFIERLVKFASEKDLLELDKDRIRKCFKSTEKLPNEQLSP